MSRALTTLFVGAFAAITILLPNAEAGTVPPAGAVDARIRVVAYTRMTWSSYKAT